MHQRRHGKVRVGLLLFILGGAIFLIGGGYGAWKLRRYLTIEGLRKEGIAAYHAKDWAVARRELGKYLKIRPDEVETLRMYATAQLQGDPVEGENVGQAIASYRRILRALPDDAEAFAALHRIYRVTNGFSELRFVASKRLETQPNQLQARMALAESLAAQRELEKAQAELDAVLAAPSDREPQALIDAYVLGSILKATNGPTTEAVAVIDEGIQRFPGSGSLRVRRGVLLAGLAEAAEEASEREALSTRASADFKAAETLELEHVDVHLVVADYWLNRGDLAAAEKALERAEKIDPARIREQMVYPLDWELSVFAQRARLALLKNDAEAAETFARNAAALFRDPRRRCLALPFIIELTLAADDATGARGLLNELKELLKLQPPELNEPKRMLFLEASVARGENKPYEVIRLLAGEAAGDNPALLRLLADAYIQTNQPARAARVLEKLVQGAGGDLPAILMYARVCLDTGNWRAAESALGAARALAPESADVQRLALRCGLVRQAAQSSSPENLRALRSGVSALLEKSPHDPTLIASLAAIDEQLGDVETAKATLRDGARRVPGDATPLLQLAGVLARTGDAAGAEKTLREACEKFATLAAPAAALAELLNSNQRGEEAAQVFDDALKRITQEPERRTLLLRYASFCILRGDEPTAVRTLRGLAEQSPGDVSVRSLLLDLASVRSDEALADQLVREIEQIEGTTGVQWRFQRARLLSARPERAAEAIALLEQCVAADARWTEPVLLLASLYMDQEKTQEADALCRKTLELGPNPAVANRWMNWLQRQGRFSEMREVLERFQGGMPEDALARQRIALAVSSGDAQTAIALLQAQIEGQRGGATDRAALARLIYLQSGDVTQALAPLDQAGPGDDEQSILATRVLILNSAGRVDEAVAALDAAVAAGDSYEKRLLRARYLMEIKRTADAARDFEALPALSPDGAGHAVSGEFLAQSGRLDDAVTLWEQGLTVAPGNKALERGLIKAYLQRSGAGDREKAEKLLASAEAKDSGDVEIVWLRTAEMLSSPDAARREQAAARIDAAASARSGSVAAYRGVSELALRMGKLELARTLGLRGLSRFPTDRRLALLVARVEANLGNLDGVVSRTRDVLGSNPADREALRLITDAATASRDQRLLSEVRGRIEKLRESAAEDLELAGMLAGILAAQDDPRRAIAVLEPLATAKGEEAPVGLLLSLAELHRQARDDSTAERYVAQAEAKAPRDPGVCRGRMILLAEQQKHAELTQYARAVCDESAAPELLMAAGELLANSAQAEHQRLADELLRRAVARDPQPAAYHILARLAYDRQDVDGAIALYRKLVELSPRDALALNNLAWMLTMLRDDARSGVVLAEKAVELNPSNPEFHDTLAQILLKTGESGRARRELETVLRLAPPESDQHKKAARQLEQLRDGAAPR